MRQHYYFGHQARVMAFDPQVKGQEVSLESSLFISSTLVNGIVISGYHTRTMAFVDNSKT